jgi:phosphoribosylformimino-5-aminoimidazole carboxamide ribotide isomerase
VGKLFDVAQAECATTSCRAGWLTPLAQVIVTSYLFPGCKFSLERLQELERLVGKERLVVDVR